MSIWNYALSNEFVKNEREMHKQFKTESEIGLHIVRELNERGGTMGSFLVTKIFPLYHISSKSRELLKDRLFWLMLSSITVSNKIVKESSRLKELCIIGYSISKLPNLNWVQEELVDELCEKLSENRSMEPLNIIDIN